MKSFRRRRGIDIERELRANRPEPRSELISMISGRIERVPARSRTRLGLAAALTAGLLGAVAAVGGVGIAASSVHAVAKSVVRITHTSHARVVPLSSAADQYKKTKVKLCYKGHVISVPTSQENHFRNKGAGSVSSGAKVGSKCSNFRSGKKGRRHGAPAFTG